MRLTITTLVLLLAAASTSAASGRPPKAQTASARDLDHGSLKAVAHANAGALLEPRSEYYLNAAQVYPFTEGAVYRLFAAPGLVSDVALQPGENLISVAAGDTARWVIGDTTSGAGAARRTHILVKPVAAALHTNAVIATDRRVYLVSLASTSGPGMAAISWTYPKDALMAVRESKAAALAAAPVAQGVAVDRLDFNYRIDGDRAPWTPVRAFDDGQQTFIEFPPSIGAGEVPPLFVIGPAGEAELVNYRLSGRYYIVDRLFARAELRLGAKHQLVVRIIKTNAPRRRATA